MHASVLKNTTQLEDWHKKAQKRDLKILKQINIKI